jgi:hypothetical protein
MKRAGAKIGSLRTDLSAVTVECQTPMTALCQENQLLR